MALSNKQQVFIAEYLKCWNATEAARRAGYSDKYLNTNASKLLQNTTIAAEIEARKAELMMSADEALLRLSEHARGDIGDFAQVGSSSDLSNHELSRLVKKFKKRITIDNKNDRETVDIELELYDAQAALRDIGRHHKVFTDKVEHSGEVIHNVKGYKTVSPDDWEASE